MKPLEIGTTRNQSQPKPLPPNRGRANRGGPGVRLNSRLRHPRSCPPTLARRSFGMRARRMPFVFLGVILALRRRGGGYSVGARPFPATRHGPPTRLAGGFGIRAGSGSARVLAGPARAGVPWASLLVERRSSPRVPGGWFTVIGFGERVAPSAAGVPLAPASSIAFIGFVGRQLCAAYSLQCLTGIRGLSFRRKGCSIVA